MVTGETWRLLANGRGCHVVQGFDRDKMAIVTYCNMVVGAILTVDPGTKAAACSKCIDRGAPHEKSAA